MRQAGLDRIRGHRASAASLTMLLMLLPSTAAIAASPSPGPAAMPSRSPAPVCDALCRQVPNPHYPGAVPAGPYRSVAFLLGDIAVTLPDGWVVSEDSPSELGLMPSAGLAEDDPSFIKVWRDMQPSKDEATVYGVPNTPEAMAAWLEADPDLTVGPPTEGTIGDGIPAIVLDIGIAPDAVNDYVCSTYGPYEHCVDFLTFHLFGEPFGFVDQDRVRLFLSSFDFEGNPHTLVVAVEGQDQATLTGFLPTAQAIIDSIRLETPASHGPLPSGG
jgi:hypothetical protein